MAVGVQQTNFSVGEMDPRFRARVQLQQYYDSLDRARNVIIQPLGGFYRRKGFEYIDTLPQQLTRLAGMTITCPNGGTTANANDDDDTTDVLTTTGAGTTDPYVVVHYDLGSAQAVLFADVQGLYSNHSADISGEIFIQYSTDDIAWTSLGAAIDLNNEETRRRNRRRTGPITARYWRVAKIGGTDMGANVITLSEFNLWQATGTLSLYRLARHRDTVTTKYILLYTDRNVRIYKDGVYQCDVRSIYEDVDLGVINWAQSLDTTIIVHEDYPQQRLIRQGSDVDWQMTNLTLSNIPQYPFDLVVTQPATTLTPSAESGVVTLTAGAGTFVAGDVGQYVDGNGGRARIISYTSATVVKAVTVFPFFDTTAIGSGNWDLERGYEEIWSATRGYPAAVALNKGRLAFGGGSRKSSYQLSRAQVEFDFNLGQNLDDDGIDVTISSDEDTPEIYHMLAAGGDLQIFTSSGEYRNDKNSSGITTPDAAGASEQSAHGARKGVRPVKVASGTLFIQREGRALREFVYDAIKERYQAQNISILASHLLVTPVSMAFRPSTENDESDLLFICNSDGTIAVLTTLRDQDVTAFSLLSTPGASGLFKDVAVDLTDIYAVTERTINGATVRYLEKYNEDLRMDAGYYAAVGSPTSSVSGLDWLEGEEVEIRLDGLLQANDTVTGGTVTFERDAESTIEIGLAYNWQARLQPIVQQLGDGTVIGKLKRVVDVTLELYETQNILVNGKQVYFQEFGPGVLDQGVQPFTGRKPIEGLQGFSLEGQIDLTGTTAQDCNVLGAEMRVQL